MTTRLTPTRPTPASPLPGPAGPRASWRAARATGRRRAGAGDAAALTATNLAGMAAYSLRYLGDPVLKETTPEISEIDGRLVQTVDDMFDVLYDAYGLALAAPQVGIRKRLFVYDYRDTPGVIINPVVEESDGEWTYTEGCLSIPGIYFEITRPNRVHLTGLDLDGNEVEFESDELQARMFQHELDHLNGTLMLEHLTPEQARAAKKHLLDLRLNGPRKGARQITIAADGSVLED